MTGPAFEPPYLHLGRGQSVLTERIVAILNPDSAPVRRLLSLAQASGSLVDATGGRKARAVVISDPDGVHLAALSPETLVSRQARGEMVE
jgi:regulator of extracellular matrix RemA (YlzA/DUF370 family)